MKKQSVTVNKCLYCGKEWLPRSLARPKRCPNKQCSSARWDIGRQRAPRAEQLAAAAERRARIEKTVRGE